MAAAAMNGGSPPLTPDTVVATPVDAAAAGASQAAPSPAPPADPKGAAAGAAAAGAAKKDAPKKEPPDPVADEDRFFMHKNSPFSIANSVRLGEAHKTEAAAFVASVSVLFDICAIGMVLACTVGLATGNAGLAWTVYSNATYLTATQVDVAWGAWNYCFAPGGLNFAGARCPMFFQQSWATQNFSQAYLVTPFPLALLCVFALFTTPFFICTNVEGLKAFILAAAAASFALVTWIAAFVMVVLQLPKVGPLISPYVRWFYGSGFNVACATCGMIGISAIMKIWATAFYMRHYREEAEMRAKKAEEERKEQELREQEAAERARVASEMAQARRASLANIDPADDPYGNRLAMLQSMGPEAFSSTFGSTSTLAPWANASLNPYAGNGSLNPYLANASLNPYAANASLSPYGNAAAVRAASMARANGQSALALPSGPLPPADPSAFLDTLPPELKAAADAQIRTQLEAYAPAIADHVRAVLPGAPAEAQQAAYESAMGQYADQLRAHQAASVMGSTMQLGGGLPVGPGASVVMPTPSGWLGPPSVGMGMGPGTSVPSLGPPGMRYGSPPAGMGYPATGYPAAYGSPAAVQGFPGPSPSPYGGSTSAYAAAGYGTPPPSSSPANGATSGSTINTGSPGVPDTGAGYAGQGGQGYGSGDRYGSAAPG